MLFKKQDFLHYIRTRECLKHWFSSILFFFLASKITTDDDNDVRATTTMTSLRIVNRGCRRGAGKPCSCSHERWVDTSGKDDDEISRDDKSQNRIKWLNIHELENGRHILGLTTCELEGSVIHQASACPLKVKSAITLILNGIIYQGRFSSLLWITT